VGVTRRSIAGAGLAGLGSALAGLGELRIKRRAFEDQHAAEAAQHQGDKLLEAYLSLSKELAANPAQYDALQPVAQTLGLTLPKPADAVRLKGLTGSINSAKSPLDLPTDVGAVAESMGVKPIPCGQDPMQGAGSQFAAPGMPFASTADMNPPAVADLVTLADRRKQGSAPKRSGRSASRAAEAQATGLRGRDRRQRCEE
jgi:hypothetical protein